MDAIGIFLIVIGLVFIVLVGVWVYINGWKDNGLWKILVGGISLALILIGSVLCIKSSTSKFYDTKSKYKVKRDEIRKRKQEEKERELEKRKSELEAARKLADDKDKEIGKRKEELDEESKNTDEKLNNHGPVSNDSPDDSIVNGLNNLGGKK